jgi:hypothetical protein
MSIKFSEFFKDIITINSIHGGFIKPPLKQGTIAYKSILINLVF